MNPRIRTKNWWKISQKIGKMRRIRGGTMNRKPHTPDEKAKLVLEVLQGERTINEIASEHNVHPSMLTRWKKEAIAGLPSIFENDAAKKRKEKKAHDAELEELYAQIGKLTTQLEWLKKKSGF